MAGIISLPNATRERFVDISEDPKHWTREIMYVNQMTKNNDYLEKIARNDPTSFQDAIVQVASLNLTLNPAFGYAYLVPRDNKVCLDISYKGLIYIAERDKRIKLCVADVVKEDDIFTYKGRFERPDHYFNPFSPDRESQNFVGAYCTAKISDDTWLTEVMGRQEIVSIKNVSRAKKGPWQTFPGEMIKKTVIKRASKSWPMFEFESSKLEEAISISNHTDGFDLDKSNASEINKLFFNDKGEVNE